MLSNSSYGRWIDESDKYRYKINYKHNKFGDAMWWANDGVLISPNFWQSNRFLKGMHGYRDNSLDNHTAVLTNNRQYINSLNSETIDMVELHKIILDFINN